MLRLISSLSILLLIGTFVLGESRIKFDASCITIDGKDTFIYSGAFHYFRCPKELWRDRLAKMKEAGLNCVETYVAWNWHEPLPPADVNDRSKFERLDELDEFLRLAEDEYGMHTIVRPGPYICAEWECGGFPTWLTIHKPKDFRGTWLRSDDPVFVAWTKHYLDEIARVVKPHLITNRPAGKPGTILWQIENEYDSGPVPQNVKYNHLRQLYKISREAGIDVPIFTCLSQARFFLDDPMLNENVIETVNSYPGFGISGLTDKIVALGKAHPNHFKMVTELQGGWFAQVGGRLSEDQGHTAAQINHITIAGIEYGLTVMNYYMFFGGTNFGGWGGDNQTSTYDYNAPIREHGGVGDRWLACKALGAFLAEHGNRLTRAQAVDQKTSENLPQGVTISMRHAVDGSKYIFARNTNRQTTAKGSASIVLSDKKELKIDYDLPEFGAKILFISSDGKQEWYPKEQTYPASPVVTDLPQPVTLSDIRILPDPGPTEWKTIAPDQSLEKAGVFDNRIVFYRGQYQLPENASEYNPLVRVINHDSFSVLINNQVTSIRNTPEGLFVEASKVQKPGLNDFLLVYNNSGHPNSGANVEIQKGIKSFQITRSNLPEGVPLRDWRMKIVEPENAQVATKTDFDDSAWQKTDLSDRRQLTDNCTAVYRTAFDYTDQMKQSGIDHLNIGSVDEEGIFYLNDEKIGESHDWSKRTIISMADKLKTGKNTLAIIVKNVQGTGGLSRGASLRATVGGSDALTQLAIGFSPGEGLGFTNSVFDDSNWAKQIENHSNALSNDLLKWVRMPFDLPKPKPGIWAPYKLNLQAQGEGYVYLNGHNLGRYWQAGPQRDYYLPECWLNFDGKNVIALCFRQVDKPVEVEKAVISVYSDFAEKR